MISKSLIAYAFLLGFTTSVNAHCAIQPALGVKGGNAVRNDVQRPSTAQPCGNVNIAQNLDTSTTIAANQNGSFSPTAIDFNGGTDGSRSIKTVQINADGTGKNFVPATMLVNGDANPTSVGTQTLTVQMPAGIQCTGGTSKNLCLASFTTTAGFGNCVVVSQGGSNNNTASPQGVNTPNGNAKGQQKNNAAGNKTNTTGNKTNTKVNANNSTTSNNTADNNQCDSGSSQATNATRRSTSFKRNWSSREVQLSSSE